MYKTSDAYKKAIIQPNRHFRLGGAIYLRNGETIQITDANVKDELKIETQMMSGTASEKSFDVGAVPAAKLTMTVLDEGDVHNFSGAKLEINISLQLEDGTWEKVPMGIFYIDGSSIEHVGNSISFTAYDGMLRLHYLITDEMRAALNGKTAAEAAEYLAAPVLPFEQDLSGFLNSDVTVNFSSAQVKKGRDGIMWIAQLMGCFARISREGYLEFVQLSVPWNPDSLATVRIPSREVTAAQRFDTKPADDRVAVSSVSMANDSGKIVTVNAIKLYDNFQNIPLELEKNPLLTGKTDSDLRTILTNIVYILMTMRFTPGRAEIANDPSIDAGDLIDIPEGGVVKSPFVDFYVTHNVWRYCGKHEVTAASVVPVVYDDEAAAISMFSDDGITALSGDSGLNYANPESQSSLAANTPASSPEMTELVGKFGGNYVLKWVSPYEIAAYDQNGNTAFSIDWMSGSNNCRFRRGDFSAEVYDSVIALSHSNWELRFRYDGYICFGAKDMYDTGRFECNPKMGTLKIGDNTLYFQGGKLYVNGNAVKYE